MTNPNNNKKPLDLAHQVANTIDGGNSILIALSKNPSVDALSAAIALSLILDKLGKHVTAIFSGKTPQMLSFLEPEKTFASDTNSLQDFIIAINKDKADHLRYKIDGDFVKVYVTPYRTRLSQADVEFSYGDYNVDLVIALDVPTLDDLDSALSEHGRILHNARAINISVDLAANFGDIKWSDASASSISELIVSLVNVFQEKQADVLSKASATALLAGIISATNRFSNERTTPVTMRAASLLMGAGADAQLISSSIPVEILTPEETPEEPEAQEEARPEAPIESITPTESATPTEPTTPTEPEAPAESAVSQAVPARPVAQATPAPIAPVPATPAPTTATPAPVMPTSVTTPTAPTSPAEPTPPAPLTAPATPVPEIKANPAAILSSPRLPEQNQAGTPSVDELVPQGDQDDQTTNLSGAIDFTPDATISTHGKKLVPSDETPVLPTPAVDYSELMRQALATPATPPQTSPATAPTPSVAPNPGTILPPPPAPFNPAAIPPVPPQAPQAEVQTPPPAEPDEPDFIPTPLPATSAPSIAVPAPKQEAAPAPTPENQPVDLNAFQIPNLPVQNQQTQ